MGQVHCERGRRDDARGPVREVSGRVAVLRSHEEARSDGGERSKAVEEVQDAVLGSEAVLLLPRGALLSDAALDAGSKWVHALHIDEGQLDGEFQWSPTYLHLCGDIARAYQGFEEVEFKPFISFCEEVWE